MFTPNTTQLETKHQHKNTTQYLADENEDEDTEVRVTISGEETAAAAELRTAILRRGGREAVREAVRSWAEELKAGAPLKSGGGPGGGGGGGESGAEAGAAAAAGGADGAKTAAVAKASAPGAAAAAAPAAAKPKAKAAAAASSRTSLRLEETFLCRPQDLFECFTQVPRLSAFTQSPATSEPRPGGAFSWFAGNITGTFVEVDAPSRLVLDWRFSSWADGCASRVEVALKETEPGTTVLSLSQDRIPEEDRFGNHDVKTQVEVGWRERVFRPVRQIFGFGA